MRGFYIKAASDSQANLGITSPVYQGREEAQYEEAFLNKSRFENAVCVGTTANVCTILESFKTKLPKARGKEKLLETSPGKTYKSLQNILNSPQNIAAIHVT